MHWNNNNAAYLITPYKCAVWDLVKSKKRTPFCRCTLQYSASENQLLYLLKVQLA